MFVFPCSSSQEVRTHNHNNHSGNACIDEAGKNIVIDNIGTGFDVYPIGRSSPSHTFQVSTMRQHIRGVVFCEKGSAIVGGSDHGRVYLFYLKASEIRSDQVMKHGSQSSMIQAIAVRC